MNKIKEPLKKLIKKNGSIAFILCLVMFAFLAITQTKLFFNPFNLQALMLAIAPEGIIALGMMILLITGVFDLSVGSVMAFAGLMTAMLLGAGLPIIVSVIGGLAAGVAIGFINGMLVEFAGINPLISTIGTMYIFRGATELLMVGRGVEYNAFPENFVQLGRGDYLGVYWMFWILVVLVIILTIFIATRPTGRRLYFIGGNENLAKLMGIKKRKIRISAFMLSGFLAALAGILIAAKSDAANRYVGQVSHMNVIIACVIGGGSLYGGKGSIPGALFGIMFLSFLQNAFNIFEFESSMQRIMLGFVLMAVVSIDGFMTLRRQKELGRI
jgi:ribose transport system permease protein